MNRAIAAAAFFLASITTVYAVPTAIYSPSTGNIKFVDVAFSGHLVIESASGAVMTGFLGGAYDRNYPVSVQNQLPHYAGFLSAFGKDFPNPYDAGVVIKPGTPVTDLTLNYYHYTGPGGLLVGNVVAVPEPSTGMLASTAIAAVGLLRRRRK